MLQSEVADSEEYGSMEDIIHLMLPLDSLAKF
jgi:hypothetical protein